MARIKYGAIEVDGLAQLNLALKTLGPKMPGQLRKANKSVADFVADDARAAAYSIGGVAAHVAPSVKSSAGVGFAGVSFGGPGYEMAGGAEFGAAQDNPRHRKTGTYVGYRQFEPWRGNGSDAGYFVYPSIRRDADRIETEYGSAIDHLLELTGLKA